MNKASYLEKFKQLHKQKTGVELSDEQVLSHFMRLTTLVAAVFQPIPVKALEQNFCPACQRQIHFDDLKNQLSINEFLISGLCQKCQDETFETYD